MGRYIVRRLLWMVLTMFVVSAITFTLMHSVPGGPFDKEKALPPEIIAILDKRYHLNDPLIVQYFDYLSNVIVPKLSSVPPNTSLLDDAIVNIKVGDKQWIKWMNFGPSFTSRSRT
ncbi:MAG: hypothetical protein WA089_22735, partial [Anaerolineae bacterium]